MAEIMISNKLTAKYDLKGFNESIIDIAITVGTYIDDEISVEISTKATTNSIKIVNIEVVFSNYSDIAIEISPSVISSIPIEIEVNPHNRMSVYYELTTPPTVIVESFPVQDSFVIERSPYSSINYGKNNSMIVGLDQKGENIAFVKFDTSEVPFGIVMKSAKARFYYSQLSLDEIEILKVNGVWNELSITYENKPNSLIPISKIYDINSELRYIEFDITSTANEWVNGYVNDGLALKANSGISVFGTREFPLSPELVIEYYSPLPFSTESSKKQIEITVANLNNSEKTVELEVKNNFEFNYVPFEIFTKQKDEVFIDEIEIEIEVPSFKDKNDIQIAISVMEYSLSEVSVELEIPLYDDHSYVNVEITTLKYAINDIKVELEVSDYTNSEELIEVEIEVSEVNVNFDEIKVEINIVNNGESKSEVSVLIEVATYEYSGSIPIEIEVPIEVLHANSIEVEIDIQGKSSSDIEIEIEVEEYLRESKLLTEINVQARRRNDVEVAVDVGLYYDLSEVEVTFEVAKYTSDESLVEVELEVRSYEAISEIEVSLDIIAIGNSDIEVKIEAFNNIVNNKDIRVELTIPTSENSNIEFVIEVPLYTNNSNVMIELEVPPRYRKSEISIELAVWDSRYSEVQFEIMSRETFISQIEVELEVGLSKRYSYVFMF